MNLLIKTGDPGLYIKLKDTCPPGAGIKLAPSAASRDNSLSEVIFTVLITFATGISTSLIASWIYEAIKKKGAKKVTINNREININYPDGQTVRIIEKIITEEAQN